MAYCSNCGTKITEEDVFCTNCGARVQAGAATSEERNAPIVSINVSDVKNNDIVKGIGNLFGGMFLKPIDTVKEAALNAKKEVVIVATVLIALIQGLLGLWKSYQIMGQLEDSVMELMSKIANLAVMFGKDALDPRELLQVKAEIVKFKGMLKVPAGSIFAQNAGMYLAAIVLSFVLIFAGCMVFHKTSIEPMHLFAVLVAASLPFIYGEVFAILISYVSATAGFCVFLAGAFMSFAVLVVAAREGLVIGGQGAVMTVSVAQVIVTVAIFYLFARFFSSNVTSLFSGVMGKLMKLN